MRAERKQLRVALFLGILFLAAQFHFCSDLASDPNSLHECPLCTVAGSAVLASAPAILVMPAVSRLELPSAALETSHAFYRAISPRAPPAV
jgi:hypothetical protein